MVWRYQVAAHMRTSKKNKYKKIPRRSWKIIIRFSEIQQRSQMILGPHSSGNFASSSEICCQEWSYSTIRRPPSRIRYISKDLVGIKCCDEKSKSTTFKLEATMWVLICFWFFTFSKCEKPFFCKQFWWPPCFTPLGQTPPNVPEGSPSHNFQQKKHTGNRETHKDQGK